MIFQHKENNDFEMNNKQTKQYNSSYTKQPNCSTNDCKRQVQATCLNCKVVFCFKCSLAHAQAEQNHQILELPQAIEKFSRRCKKLHGKLIQSVKQQQKKRSQNEKDEAEILQTQMFQVQLKNLKEIQQKTSKIIASFFKFLNLQLSNIWENYLTIFSGLFIDNQQEKLLESLRKFSNPNQYQQGYLSQYYKFDFQNSVEQICRMRQQRLTMNPQIPMIKVVQNYENQIYQFLSKTVFTVDYKKQKVNNQKKLNIQMSDFLFQSVKIFPILPVQQKICYLYNFQQNAYRIKKFQNLDFLPQYPRTILIPNGDLHIIGGIQKDQILSANHIVFRPTKNQIFKLGLLPRPISPYNGLVFNDEAIYVIGGHTQKSHWDIQCMKFDLVSNKWSKIASLNKSKRNQSCCAFNKVIYCFGVSQQQNGQYLCSIQKYVITENSWKSISISNPFSNPFNFYAAFDSIQINKDQILLFGGKKYYRCQDGKIKSDRLLCQDMFVYRPESQSFVQLGKLGMGIGVQYGQLNPIIRDNKIYSIEFLLSQSNPVVRWFETIQIVEITEKGTVQSLVMLTSD